MRGESEEIPDWLPILLAAENHWHVPPWVIEEEATREWWQRYKAYHDELGAYNKKKAKEEAPPNLTAQTG